MLFLIVSLPETDGFFLRKFVSVIFASKSVNSRAQRPIYGVQTLVKTRRDPAFVDLQDFRLLPQLLYPRQNIISRDSKLCSLASVPLFGRRSVQSVSSEPKAARLSLDDAVLLSFPFHQSCSRPQHAQPLPTSRDYDSLSLPHSWGSQRLPFTIIR